MSYRVYYSDGSRFQGEISDAPREGVQVVVLMRPYDGPYPGWTPWAGAKPDRQIWTGEDEYVIEGVTLTGSEIDFSAYLAIFQRAATED